MGLGLYDVGSPAEKALAAQGNAIGTMAAQTKQESSITKTTQGTASRVMGGLSGAASGAATGAAIGGVPGAIAGGILGLVMSIF